MSATWFRQEAGYNHANRAFPPLVSVETAMIPMTLPLHRRDRRDHRHNAENRRADGCAIRVKTGLVPVR